MRTPRIKIVSRHEGLAPIVRMIKMEAEERGISINPKSYDVAVAVGGDGTLISAAVEGKPVMTVKGGSKNHLIDIPQEKVGEAFDRLLEGRFREEKYCMLETTHRKKKVLAFNEIGITAVVPLPIGFSVSYMETELDALGDGVIVSTPQGSTGWSFSSNGTYVSRSADVFIVSLLNPVMMPLKSVVIPQVSVRLKMVPKDRRDKAVLVSDGNIISHVEDGEEVTIRKSKKEAVVYRFFKHGMVRSWEKGALKWA